MPRLLPCPHPDDSHGRLLVGLGAVGEPGRVAVRSFARWQNSSAAGRAAEPAWASGNAGLGRRYTLGVEEEVMLLQPDRRSLAQSSDRVLAGLSDELVAHTA